MIDTMYGIQLHEGMRYNQNALFKFGSNDSVGTDEETIWDQGGIYAYPSSASVMKVSSSDDADTSTVVISGLNADYNEVSEAVTLTGQTPVETDEQFIRVFRARVTDNAPAGDIYIGTGTVTSGVPDNVFAKIIAGENQTLMAVWTVPAGYTAYLFQCTISSGTEFANRFVTAKLKVRPFGEVFQTKALVTIKNTFIPFDFGVPVAIPEKSDVEARAFSSSGTQHVAATFSAIYKKNNG